MKTLSNPRMVYFVPNDAYVEDHGWRPSIVVEGEDGHHPTGTWPYSGKVGETMPYFWGHDYDAACRTADAMNERLGVSKEDAEKIVDASVLARIMGRGYGERIK